MFQYKSNESESKLTSTPQGKIIYSLLSPSVPKTAKQIISELNEKFPSFKTNQTKERVVGFYLCVWKKENSVIAEKISSEKKTEKKISSSKKK